jgi:hypothetical protein
VQEEMVAPVKLADGDAYEGEWLIGNFHGRGIYTWADGDRFEGDYLNGQRHGRGIMTYANKDR